MGVMTPDQYKEIEKAVEEGTPLTQEQIDMLIKTVSRLDGTMFVFQNSLQLMAESMASAVPQLAQKVMQRCGRTDKKIKKAIAEMAAETVVSIEESIQRYMVTCMLQLAEHLSVSIEDLIATGEPEDEEQPTS